MNLMDSCKDHFPATFKSQSCQFQTLSNGDLNQQWVYCVEWDVTLGFQHSIERVSDDAMGQRV
jgi:hypothetical protein